MQFSDWEGEDLGKEKMKVKIREFECKDDETFNSWKNGVEFEN